MSRDATVLDNDKKLKRDIGIFATGFLVLNGVIGAGIFGLPGRLVEQAGMFGPVSYTHLTLPTIYSV